MDNELLIDRIKSLAKEKGIKLKFICSKLGVAESYIGNVKSGRDRMTPERLEIIADILDTTPEYLSGNSEEITIPESQNNAFSIRLKQLRESSGDSQYAFADKFGISQSTIGNWEAGKREPSFGTLLNLADYFNVSTDYLLGRETQKKELAATFEDERQAELLEVFNRMPDEESKEKLIELVRSFELMNNYEIQHQYIGGIAAKGGNKSIIHRIPSKSERTQKDDALLRGGVAAFGGDSAAIELDEKGLEEYHRMHSNNYQEDNSEK